MATGQFDLSNLQFWGRVGDLVFLPQPNGRAIVRRMPAKPPRRTALQRSVAQRVTEAAAAWKALTQEEGEAWNRYAAVEGRRGYNAFVGLSAKRLQMFSDEPLPRLPPTSAFLGDGVVVTVGDNREAVVAATSVVACAAVQKRSRAATEAAATGPSDLGLSGIVFSSSGPNSEGIVTELLVQPLKSLHRKPLAKEYKSRGFVAFAGEPVSVPCGPGPYACAIRFVRAAMGQETAVVPLGKVVV